MGRAKPVRPKKAPASLPASGAPQPIPRASLISHAADTLRNHIQAGTWTHTLPGERQLCEILLISRPTLRSALSVLEKEGLLEVSQGKHRTLRAPQVPRRSRQQKISEVIILIPIIPTKMQPQTLFLIDEIYKCLQKSGLTLSVQFPSWLNFKRPDIHLARHVKEHPSACWALFGVSEAVQQWFAAQTVPALVSGSCFPSVKLASLDFDYNAMAKHAVGTFLRKGYQQIILMVPEKFRPGDTLATTAFQDAVKQYEHRDLKWRILRISSHRDAFKKQLAECFSSPDPVAVYIYRPFETLFVLSYLLQKNIAIGSKVGLICGGDETYLDNLVIKPARYTLNREKFAAKFCQMLLQLALTRTVPARANRMMVDFEAGDTV